MSLVTFDNLKRFFEGLKTKPLVFSGDISFNGTTKYKNKELATKADILTKTSQLTNDSGYLTKADLANTYLGKSDNAVSATTATKVGTATVGSVSTPVYINAGTPTACTSISVGTITATTALNIPGGKIWIE